MTKDQNKSTIRIILPRSNKNELFDHNLYSKKNVCALKRKRNLKQSSKMFGVFLMPSNNQESNVVTNNAGNAASLAGSAAAGAVKKTFLKNPPQLLQRLYYWVKHNETTLTNPGAKEAFDLFYNCVCDILETTESPYPERLETCLKLFENTLPTESVYHFHPLATFDIHKIQQQFQASNLKVHGRRIKQDSLTGAVINYLVDLDCMRANKTLSVQKVIYCFLVSMSLEFADTQNSIEKKELVILMSKVIGIASGEEKILRQYSQGFLGKLFFQATFPPVRKLSELFETYLDNENHLSDAEAVFIASQAFKNNQVEIAKLTTTLKIILSEGSALNTISTDMARIARNDLSQGTNDPLPFSKKNPFARLLQDCAQLFRPADEDYKLNIDFKLLIVPDKTRIAQFVSHSLNEAAKFNGSPIILGQLLKVSACEGNKTTTQLIPSNDWENINVVTDLLFELATWERKHTILGHIASMFNVAVATRTQLWHGEYARFIERFMTAYNDSLTLEFEPLLTKIKKHILLHIESDNSTNHGVIKIIEGLQLRTKELQAKGIKPLKDFKDYRLKVTPILNEMANSLLYTFYMETPSQLQLINMSTNASTSPPLSLGVSKNTMTHQPTSDFNDSVTGMITNYIVTNEHHYKFRLPNLDQCITITPADPVGGDYSFEPKSSNKHKDRTELFYNLFRIIHDRSLGDAGKLYAMQTLIHNKQSQKHVHFLSDKPNGISILLTKILLIISKQLKSSASSIITDTASAIVSPKETKQCALASECPIPASPSSDLSSETMAEAQKPKTVKAVNPFNKENQSMTTALVKDLQIIVQYFSDHPNEQSAFLSFWESLCYLNNEVGFWKKIFSLTIADSEHTKMVRCHTESLIQLKFAEKQLVCNEELHIALLSGTPERITWAVDVLSPEGGGAVVSNETRLACLSKVTNQVQDLKTTVKKASNIQTKYLESLVGYSAVTVTAWPKAKEMELKKQWETYAKKIRITTPVDLFFQNIASRLLQSDIIDPDVERQLSELLSKAIQSYIDLNSADPIALAHHKGIIRGLLMLGANPLTWINSQLDKLAEPNCREIATTSMIGQLTQIMLSHLSARSACLGDSAVILSVRFQTLINATNAFGTQLHTSIEDTLVMRKIGDFLWGWAFNTRHVETGIEEERRPERAKLYWSGIKLIHTIINDALIKKGVTVGDAHRESDQLTDAKNKLQVYRDLCKTLVRKGWFINAGLDELNNFLAAIDGILEILPRLGTTRALHALSVMNEDKDAALKEQGATLKEQGATLKELDAQKQELGAALLLEKDRQNQSIFASINGEIEERLPTNEEERTPVVIEQLRTYISKKITKIFSLPLEQSAAYVDECLKGYLPAQPLLKPFVAGNPAGLHAQPTAAQSTMTVVRNDGPVSSISH